MNIIHGIIKTQICFCLCLKNLDSGGVFPDHKRKLGQVVRQTAMGTLNHRPEFWAPANT